MPTAGLKQYEEDILVTLLRMVGQPWSAKFYNALAPLVRVPTTDLVLIDEQGRVFMTQRPEEDAFEPGYWHFPGTVVRVADTSNEMALERIGRRELGLEDRSEVLDRIVRAKLTCEGFNDSRRGPEVNRYYIAKLDQSLARFLGGKGVGSFVSFAEFKGLRVLDHHVKINIWSHF